MAEENQRSEASEGGAEKAGHGAAPKAATPATEPWESELVTALRQQFGPGVREAATYLGQHFLVIERDVIEDVLLMLRDDGQFDYCVDITAVNYPERQGQEFEVVYILYSFPRGERLRVKTPLADGQSIPSAVPLWPTANWLERECFDMFGIRFEGHPDLRRILLPEEWKGHPLRKDYSILQQDNEWVQINLGIESGQ